MRSDIFDSLRDNDINEHDEFIVRLNWARYEGSRYDFKKVVEARISASSSNRHTQLKVWNDIAAEEDIGDCLPYVKSLWSYTFSQTYERPRDIIKFFKCCSKQPIQEELKLKHIIATEKRVFGMIVPRD